MIASNIVYVIYGYFSDAIFSRIASSMDETSPHFNLQLVKDQDTFSLLSADGSLMAFVEPNPELLTTAQQASNAIVITSHMHQELNLESINSLHTDITTILALEHSVAVLDLIAPRLLSFEEWNDLQEYIASSGDESKNVTVNTSLYTEGNNNYYWLHTRGMLKYGLPDLSLTNVAMENVQFLIMENVQFLIDVFYYLINELIYTAQTIQQRLNQGSVLIVRFDNEEKLVFEAIFKGSMDDDNFNNYHLELIPSEA